jgi:hypothetical protein
MEEKSNFHRRGAKVVEKLRFVNGLQHAAGFELDNYTPVHNQVREEVADDLTTVLDLHSNLMFGS